MDEVLLGKAEIIERCLRRIDAKSRGHINQKSRGQTR